MEEPSLTSYQFSFFNNFSGQVSFESWTFSLSNVVFTVLPPLVIGVFDQFVSARILDRYPQLYLLGQKNTFFTKTAFWQWIANAFYHSLVLFAFSIVLFWGDLKQSTGLDSGLWFWGTTLYLATLLAVLGKAALVSEYVFPSLFLYFEKTENVCIVASGQSILQQLFPVHSSLQCSSFPFTLSSLL